jgi:hypothetical protein
MRLEERVANRATELWHVTIHRQREVLEDDLPRQ